MCAFSCPASAQVDESGRIVKVDGELCLRGRHVLDLQYHPDRLLHPLVRENGALRRATWDEALDRIVRKLSAIRDEHGPQSVLFFAGYPKEGRPWLQRLAYLFGSPHYATEDSFCFAATFIAAALNYGPEFGWFIASGRNGFEGTRCHLLWSSNPGVSATPMVRGRLLDGRRAGMQLIVVDPRRTETAETADLHLQLRPGTDGALALGMMHVIIDEGLYDQPFVERWTVGFGELRDLVGEYPPRRVATITGVPSQKIVEAARLYATSKPAKLQTSPCATVHTSNGVQNHRAILLLPALTGNLDVPGGNKMPAPAAPTNDITQFDEKLPLLEPQTGAGEFPIWSMFYREEQANATAEQLATGKPYPIKAMIGLGANVMIWPNTKRVAEAIGKLEFFAAADYFETVTTDLAEVVLPAATGLERAHLSVGPGGIARLRDPVVEPLGEAWSDGKILMELGVRLGLADQFWHGDLEACMNHILAPTGVTTTQLREHSHGLRLVEEREARSYEQHGFNTPSGKVEISSSILAEHGFDPLPTYREPAESPVSTPDVAERFGLVLTTGARSKAYTHSQFRRLPELRKLMPEPVVQISIEDATARRIRTGDRVVIESRRGRIEVEADVTDRVQPGVVHVYHGWAEANVNELTDHRALDPLSGYPPLKSALCEIRPAVTAT
jgi:anaerobic selenocysteine-containing dehydrogenase